MCSHLTRYSLNGLLRETFLYPVHTIPAYNPPTPLLAMFWAARGPLRAALCQPVPAQTWAPHTAGYNALYCFLLYTPSKRYGLTMSWHSAIHVRSTIYMACATRRHIHGDAPQSRSPRFILSKFASRHTPYAAFSVAMKYTSPNTPGPHPAPA